MRIGQWLRMITRGPSHVPRWAVDGGGGYVVDSLGMTTDPRLIANHYDALIGALIRMDELLQESRDSVAAAAVFAIEQRDSALAEAAQEDLAG